MFLPFVRTKNALRILMGTRYRKIKACIIWFQRALKAVWFGGKLECMFSSGATWCWQSALLGAISPPLGMIAQLLNVGMQSLPALRSRLRLRWPHGGVRRSIRILVVQHRHLFYFNTKNYPLRLIHRHSFFTSS